MRTDKTITMEKVTRGLIRQSDHIGKTWTGITNIPNTNIQPRLGSNKWGQIGMKQDEECNELV